MSLELAAERSVDSLLQLIVQRLAERPNVALARVWILAPGDRCETCALRDECEQNVDCLHLVASAGRSIVDDGFEWTGVEGRFSRFPLGRRKIGTIGSRLEPIEVRDIEVDGSWIADTEWAQSEGIRGFGGQPLLFRGELRGVLGVFTRVPLADGSLMWLRMLADHAASAIANAEAFAEIHALKQELELENEYLREEVLEAHAFGDLVGQSSALRQILEQIELVAPTDASVLILGESGTGKELVAREIHGRGARADRPLVRVNCAAVPRELYESEFFGHSKGAFTGATRDRSGRFELADGGTLFLDEVGEIPLELQSKLLRVLQEGTYERLGDERTRTVDTRIIAATNRDLKEEVDAGRFRQDLYYRLNVFPIAVPPLRDRVEDIPLLAVHFLERGAKKLGREAPRLSPAAAVKLQAYSWPGNVRELQNVIERALIASPKGGLRIDLPSGGEVDAPPTASEPTERRVLREDEMRRLERDNIALALDRTDWRVYGEGGAADMLGLKPTTLASRMKKLDLKRQ